MPDFDGMEEAPRGKKGKNVRFAEEEQGGFGGEEIEEDEFYKEVEAQKKARKQQKEEDFFARKAPREAVEEEEEGDGKRGITRQMEKNTGIKKKRAAVRNPRVKNKLKYEKVSPPSSLLPSLFGLPPSLFSLLAP